MATTTTGLHVIVFKEDNGLFNHKFYYGTDLRFDKSIPCVDAAAIVAWCNGSKYRSLHINF